MIADQLDYSRQVHSEQEVGWVCPKLYISFLADPFIGAVITY